MKKLLAIIFSAIIIFTQFSGTVLAEDTSSPEKPIDITESETRDVYVIGTRTLSYSNLTGNIKFLTTGTATKITDAWGNVTFNHNLTTILYSYTVTSGVGYPTLTSVSYPTTPGHRLQARVTVLWHGGPHDGESMTLTYLIF
ncbi:MAG: hypothetical protein IJ115_07045 [Erysipelotrichaceae bacterium]|nr:hypothetical protein [Erysipelotrichaceae bacterium]